MTLTDEERTVKRVACVLLGHSIQHFKALGDPFDGEICDDCYSKISDKYWARHDFPIRKWFLAALQEAQR